MDEDVVAAVLLAVAHDVKPPDNVTIILISVHMGPVAIPSFFFAQIILRTFYWTRLLDGVGYKNVEFISFKA